MLVTVTILFNVLLLPYRAYLVYNAFVPYEKRFYTIGFRYLHELHLYLTRR